MTIFIIILTDDLQRDLHHKYLLEKELAFNEGKAGCIRSFSRKVICCTAIRNSNSQVFSKGVVTRHEYLHFYSFLFYKPFIMALSPVQLLLYSIISKMHFFKKTLFSSSFYDLFFVTHTQIFTNSSACHKSKSIYNSFAPSKANFLILSMLLLIFVRDLRFYISDS